MHPIILLYLFTIAIIITIIIQSETPSKALAYIMLVILFPIVGSIIYLSFGVNYRKRKIYKKKLEYDKAAFPELSERLASYSTENIKINKQKLGVYYNLANNNERILTSGNEATLLINGERKFPKMLEALRAAKHFIHLEYYIYENDNIGREIADILIQKAQEGVEVRFIYDDFGSLSIRRSFVNRLRKAGVEAIAFYRIRWILFANRINYRNHRKICVIDGDIGYVGGINISDKYINDGQDKLYWRDTSVELRGLSVATLQWIFLSDWNYCAQQNIQLSEKYFPGEKKLVPSTQEKLVQIVASGPDSDHPSIMYSMIQAILLAQKEILITTPYFSPTTAFIDALMIAAKSGVDVQLIVPGVSDSSIVNAVSNSYYADLLSVGIKLYKYTKGFVHAKTMVCDSFVTFVGTTNLDQRSFELNFEVHSIVYDYDYAAELRDAFLDDLKHSRQLNYDDWMNRSKGIIFLERLTRLLSPLM